EKKKGGRGERPCPSCGEQALVRGRCHPAPSTDGLPAGPAGLDGGGRGPRYPAVKLGGGQPRDAVSPLASCSFGVASCFRSFSIETLRRSFKNSTFSCMSALICAGSEKAAGMVPYTTISSVAEAWQASRPNTSPLRRPITGLFNILLDITAILTKLRH